MSNKDDRMYSLEIEEYGPHGWTLFALIMAITAIGASIAAVIVRLGS